MKDRIGEFVGRELEIDIRPYEGQKTAKFEIGGIERVGRVDWLGPEEPEFWIVSNDPECFNDIPFIGKIAGKMAELLRPFDVDCLFVPETRSLMTAKEIARVLGHTQMAVARKKISPAPPEIYKVEYSSTTSGKKELNIDGETKQILANAKRIAIFDDVISTTGTTDALLRLADVAEARAKVVAISAPGIEGPAVYKNFEEFFLQGRLVYLSVFPLWATGETLKALRQEEAEVRARFAGLPAPKNVLKL